MPKYLILRFSSIGDIVLTTPVIRCLKQQVSGAEVHFLTRKSFESVVSNNPYIDKLWLFENSATEIAEQLKNEHYDGIIDLHHNARTQMLKWTLRRPSFSFRKLNLEKWLSVNLKINRLPDLHIVDRYLETVASLGVKNDGKGLDYFINKTDRNTQQRLPASHREKFIAVAIGAQHATKRLPEEKLIRICNRLKYPVILLGGKSDVETGANIARACGSNVLSLCGQLSLNESAAVIESAEVLLTHDTGLMHIGAALRRPVVSVWGNTIPAFGMTPYYGTDKVDHTIFEVGGLSCRPCTKIGFAKCPKGHFKCMMDQDEKSIAECVMLFSENN